MALLTAGLCVAVITPGPGRADNVSPHRLVVLPFEIEDTSGEVGAPDRHAAMLQMVTQVVAGEIAAKGLYKVVPEANVAEAIAAVDPGTYLRSCNGCELDIAKRAGADRVMIGWIYKVSTLVGTLHIVVKDVATGKVVYAHVFDFRGDNEKAWRHAAGYMVRALAKRAGNGESATN